MKIINALNRIGIVGILLLGFSSCRNSESINSYSTIAITGVNIIDMVDGTVSSNMTIIIKENVISEIGLTEKLEPPKQAKILNASGKYAIPGLWDMHAHTSSDSITREILFPTFIANGVTGIRNMIADCYDNEDRPCAHLGIEMLNIERSRKIQEDVATGRLIGPRTILGSALVMGPEPGKPSTVQDPGTTEHGRQHVKFLMERGVDFIKVYNPLPREAYFGIAEEAKKQGLPIEGHIPDAIKASEASDAGQKSIEHCCMGNLFEECSTREEELKQKIMELWESDVPKGVYEVFLELVKSYDDTKCQAIYQKFIENGTWFVPTLIVGELHQPNTLHWKDDPRLKYVPRKEVHYWSENETYYKKFGVVDPLIRQKRFEMVRDMNKAGVNLLAGSDCGEVSVFWGSGLHDELELLVEAGLTELEALQAATLKPAEFENLSDSLGNIKKGMLADLILLDANPLENISNTQRIFSVIANGKYFDRLTLDGILDKVEIEAAK